MIISSVQAAAVLLSRREARRSLTAFASRVPIPGAPMVDADESAPIPLIETSQAAHHRLILEEMQRCMSTPYGRLMIMSPPGSAKALALDTPIPTPSGWTTMGQIAVGDRVLDERGTPCNVIRVSPIWRARPVFAVETDCGDIIVADHDHEWLVRLCGKPSQAKAGNPRGNGREFQPFKIKETHELCRRRAKRPMIEHAAPIELPEADLPIDPYVLGQWLGNGDSSGTVVMTCHHDDQAWLMEEFGRLGYMCSPRSKAGRFGVLGVRDIFVQTGLLNTQKPGAQGGKHVPAQYLRASKAQRLALLQGLIDSDGTVCKQRGCTTFTNTNLALAEAVQELVRSLGVKAGLTEGRATLNGVDCGPVWRVAFYLAGSARMPRKAVLTRDQWRTPGTYIDVTPAGIADTVCIEVDSASHLFLCGRSMTPTHNSTYATVVAPAWYLGRNPGKRVILASYGDDLARRHGRRTLQLLRSSEAGSILQTSINPKRDASDDFALINGSEYLACGIMAGITGNRCMTADTMLRTPDGMVAIDRVSPSSMVLSYDHAASRLVYRQVMHIVRSIRTDIVRVRTVAGREFTCTSDHPVYVVGKGYVEAALLEQADTLIAVGAPIGTRGVCPPLRRGCAEQRAGELGSDVSGVPHAAPQVENDAVSLVEPVCAGGIEVYDIGVEETHNFFANEVLVHNCEGLVIDDPIKGREQADSQTIRDKTFAAYEDDLLTRLIPGGWVTIINTRWHEDDVAGRILPADWSGQSGDIACRDGNTWRVLCLQAECQQGSDPLGRQVGEMLWPQWFDAKHWSQFRLNRRTWSSLYQQLPAPADGILFRRDDMATYDRAPEGLRIIGAGDYAVTPDGGDWTELGVMGIGAGGERYLLDWWRGQVGPEVWVERQIDMIARWRPLMWCAEVGPIRRAMEGRIRQRMIERDTPCRLEWMPSIGDKTACAQSIIAIAGMGRLMWPRAAWVPELQRQCLVFPAGQPDDGVDCLGQLGRGADMLGGVGRRKVLSSEQPEISGGWQAI